MAAYFAIISPRLIHAHKTWGSAFYSLPSFWFWADDWETCVNKYADCRKVRLATLPIEEQPTMQGYFHRHDLGDALVRLQQWRASRGWSSSFIRKANGDFSVERKDKPKRIVLPHRGLYLIGLASARARPCAVWPLLKDGLRSSDPITLPVLLGLTTFVVYVMATGWYLPTGPGHRFIMTLVYAAALDGGPRRRATARGLRTPVLPTVLYLVGHLAIGVLLLTRVVALLQDTRFEKISYAF